MMSAPVESQPMSLLLTFNEETLLPTFLSLLSMLVCFYVYYKSSCFVIKFVDGFGERRDKKPKKKLNRCRVTLPKPRQHPKVIISDDSAQNCRSHPSKDHFTIEIPEKREQTSSPQEFTIIQIPEINPCNAPSSEEFISIQIPEDSFCIEMGF